MLAFTVLACLLAALAGFATQRGSICAVHAVEDLLEEGRATRFLGFFECALWVLVATALLCLLFDLSPPQVAAHELTLGALAGGLVFGLGAAVNGSCTFGSLARIAAGELSVLLFLPGLLFGALAGDGLPERLAPMLRFAPPLTATRAGLLLAGLLALALLSLRLGYRWRSAGRPRLRPASLLAPQWDPGLAMAVLGFANAPLFLLVGPWAYSALLSAYARGERPAAVLALLATALLLGALLGGASAGRLRLVPPRPLPALRSLAGGSLMGLGAELVPGGNDVLVLQSMPALRPEAWIAYLAMLLGIALLVGPRLLRAGRPVGGGGKAAQP